jgi:hypothetical protein
MADTWGELNTSRFFKQEDVADKPLVLTIASIDKEEVEFQAGKETGVVVRFKETERQVYAKTVLKSQLAELFPDSPASAVGQKIELYRDPNVMMGPKKTGGLRFRAPTGASAVPF